MASRAMLSLSLYELIFACVLDALQVPSHRTKLLRVINNTTKHNILIYFWRKP